MKNESSRITADSGWVKRVDPGTGRVFYANHITRKTQWEPPDGWVGESPPTPRFQSRNNEEPLPSNWETMHDPSTGKPFYVDHERKITQWTRPRAEKRQEKQLRPWQQPASAEPPRPSHSKGTTSCGSNRTYSEEAAYNQRLHSGVSSDVDLSGSMPELEFSVRKVADKHRLNCAHCAVLFTVSKRRHHCRLCGDVFCDACSSHRVDLPLPGPEFDKPVRICDFCNEDVRQGNFFSLRRYLTPLALFDPNLPGDGDFDNADVHGVASSSNVNAALCALTSDLDEVMRNTNGFEKRVTIPPSVLVPSITKHLTSKRDTADRAVRALSSLLTIGSMVGKNDFAHAVYLYGGNTVFDSILTILERSGSDERTLFVQEQAARAVFYLTDAEVLSTLMQTHSQLVAKQTSSTRSSGSTDDDEGIGDLDSLDIQRSLANFLDHASSKKNPNLQRWSAATVRNLVVEDQRRSCLAINEVAACFATGETTASLGYESLIDQMVSSGGIMILCSLVGTDDSDTRTHAIAALGAVISATRAVDEALASLYEMTGGVVGRTDKKDGDILRAISASGGCGSSVSQLLLSADNSVASTGCQFLASLVRPLLLDPLGCATLPPQYDWRNDDSGMGACREAAIEIASESCLPALESLVREKGRTSRPAELRRLAMETLAATVMAVGEMGKSWAGGKYEEGMENNGSPATLLRAVASLNDEGLIDMALEILESSSMQSLGSTKDTPTARIRECAGIVLGSLTSCSAEAIMELHSRHLLSSLVLAANDDSMAAPSNLRGDTSPRCLGMLEAASAVLMFAWQHPSGASSELLDRLIELLDAGTITYLFRMMTSKIDWESRDKSSGGMKARSAACRLVCCLFGIAMTDKTAIGMRRLMDACDEDEAQRMVRNGPRNIMEAVLTVLQKSLVEAHKVLVGGASRGPHYQAALLDLVECSILATGSICGSAVAPDGGDGTMIKGDAMLSMRVDEFESRRKEVCSVACDVVVRGGRSGPALLPTLLVGGFGEGSVPASLRLALAIAQNGNDDQHSKLALSGLLVPVSDLLRVSLARGDLYKFSAALALVRFCGPHVAAGGRGGVQSVREAIRVATNVLTLPNYSDASTGQIENWEALKSECINALESLSKNAALWSAISTDALPSIVTYLHDSFEAEHNVPETKSSALRAILQIAQVPSHAVSAAEVGLARPIGLLLKSNNALCARGQRVDRNMQALGMEVLHVLIARPESRRHCNLLQGDILRAVCAVVALSVTDASNYQSETMEKITVLGLEILLFALGEVESSGNEDTAVVLQSQGAIAFLDAVSSEGLFVRTLCSTLLTKTGMKIMSHESGCGDKETIDVPDLYGDPLLFVEQKCAGFDNTYDAAASILFATMAFACAIESHTSEILWKYILLQDLHEEREVNECVRTSSTFCAIYLRLLMEDFVGFIPKRAAGKRDYENLTRPLIRYRLLESLKTALDELTSESVLGHREIDAYMLSLLVHFNVPYICLLVWRDPALLELSFQLIKVMVEADPDEVIHLFVESKEAITSLFDLLNLDRSTETHIEVDEIQRFLAMTLEKLAQGGVLADAVEKFDVRSIAITALATACLNEEDQAADDEEELTSSKLASDLMHTLVELCTVSNGEEEKKIELTPGEAEAIAVSLGETICKMVIARFLERAKLQQYEIEEDENIMNTPDVAMLCAISQHDIALQNLRSFGGLHAIAMIAGEGEITAILALQKGCKEDPSLLIEADTYASILSLFSLEKDHLLFKRDKLLGCKVETAAFELLAQLCVASSKGRLAVAGARDFQNSLDTALRIISEVVLRINDEPAAEEDKKLNEIEDEEKEGEGSRDCQNAPKSMGDPKRLGAAYSFLSAMTPIPSARITLLNNEKFVQASSTFISDNSDRNLQFAALRAVVKLAPYSTGNGPLSTDNVGDLLQSALAAEPKFSDASSTGWNRNLFHVQAAEGILSVFDSLPASKQECIFKDVIRRYIKLLKSHSIARSTKMSERAHAGELAYNLTTLIMVARGKDCIARLFDSDATVLLVNTVQWRYDPKTVVEPDAATFWDATTTQCLQILAQLLCSDISSSRKSGINVRSLKNSVFMVARVGKAPRKAIDFISALKLVSKNGEAAAKVASQRILSYMNNNNTS
ncbi:unnamed protein product [Pseudo-nitzschia multistriata]|uniref:HECT-type E3 ubiquitin transferase n=1 Tax=Pseudo-nitzschia multistriata TaxID=183589 RepID=A0A448Z6V6_9STRA|nr:unnamed protein product [Pseudo-nitzschia multistriata]